MAAPLATEAGRRRGGLWTRDAAIDLHLACAAHFLPAARQAYGDLGLPWPQAFEDAVRSQLRRELDLALGDDL